MSIQTHWQHDRIVDTPMSTQHQFIGLNPADNMYYSFHNGYWHLCTFEDLYDIASRQHAISHMLSSSSQFDSVNVHPVNPQLMPYVESPQTYSPHHQQAESTVIVEPSLTLMNGLNGSRYFNLPEPQRQQIWGDSFLNAENDIQQSHDDDEGYVGQHTPIEYGSGVLDERQGLVCNRLRETETSSQEVGDLSHFQMSTMH
jgi:hypothetical protein